MKINAIILAAGKGTRMKSHHPKVIHKIMNKPMIMHVIDNLKKAKVSDIISVVGYQSESVEEVVKDESKYVYQTEQLGTGHAVLMAKELLVNDKGFTIVICGDTPLISSETIDKLISHHKNNKNHATILTGLLDDAGEYGRVIRCDNGDVMGIVEYKDATDQQRAIKEFNTGTYIFDNQELFNALSQVKNTNMQREYYLTDVISIMHQNNLKVDGYILDDIEQTIGINDRITLAYASSLMQERVNNFHMLNGVTIIDPKTTYISPDVKIGEDTIIYPNTTIMGNSSIGYDCEIGPDTYMENTVVLDRSFIKYSYLTDTNIKNDVQIGPYARMRSNVIVEDKAKIGNFVELKNTTFGHGSKAAHLAYLGDTTLGKNVNIGCGVITVNYDGVNKFKTTIDDDAFIGCNSNLIAPMHIGARSFVAAGTTVTEDIPENSFAIGRERQTTKLNYMKTQKK